MSEDYRQPEPQLPQNYTSNTGNPTPTPRVDAAVEQWKNRPWAGSPTDRPLMLARELERELAAAKEAATGFEFALQQERNIHMTTIAERDQLRAEVERLKAQSVRGFTYEELEGLWDKLRTDYDKARARVADLEAKSTYAQGWDDHVQAVKAQIEELEADKARLAEQIQRDNDACQKLSGFTFEELSWEFERLKNNLLNAEQQIEDANRIIGLFFEACSETNVGLFHERLGAAFETCKTYRAAIDAAREKGAT
jgi:hypothetical protein